MLHGYIFNGILRLLFPCAPAGLRFAMAAGLEAAWEIFEDDPIIINHYRKQALAQGYIGDSVLDSLFDTVSIFLGVAFT